MAFSKAILKTLATTNHSKVKSKDFIETKLELVIIKKYAAKNK